MNLNEHFEKYKARKHCPTFHFPIWKLESTKLEDFKLEMRFDEPHREITVKATMEEDSDMCLPPYSGTISDELNITIPIRYCPICGRKLKKYPALEPTTKGDNK